MVALPGREGDRVTLGRPPRLGVEPAVSQAAHIGAFRVHHVDLGRAGALGDERDLTTGGRPRGLRVDAAEGGQATEGSGGQREDVDLRVPVLGEREGEKAAQPLLALDCEGGRHQHGSTGETSEQGVPPASCGKHDGQQQAIEELSCNDHLKER